MTKYKQKEYEALILDERPIITDVKVCRDQTNPPDMLTDRELLEVTAVFRSFETGLREATIYPKDLHKAMKMLGLNPMEQEVVDIPNEIARNGLIYFPDFCEVILKRYRQDDKAEESFRQNMFKMLCGTEPFPTDFKAKKYKLDKHFLSKDDFRHMMRNLPVPVEEEDIEEMFTYADRDNDGKLSYKEFQVMVNPPAPPEIPRPTIDDFNEMRARSTLSLNQDTSSMPERFASTERLQHSSSPEIYGTMSSRFRSAAPGTCSPGSTRSKISTVVNQTNISRLPGTTRV
ncbi:calmodulin isoform X2 [Eurytemora carolleeae]|uniref:calmodulin isoform X2 n=1 Tax=Eurytemora carolleeae TaxID=1294199 RepID=UPI000C785EE0|nr:calmodulin isoform X2 [Eurytemora carolleeae]|eukprot:XP_023347863.1 calmodulin-like isoform X2 [Eurytemora affinis]